MLSRANAVRLTLVIVAATVMLGTIGAGLMPLAHVPEKPVSAGSATSRTASSVSASSAALTGYSGSSLLRSAAASLGRGDGPAHGLPWSCSGPSSAGFRCSSSHVSLAAPTAAKAVGSTSISHARPASSVHPSVAGSPYWFNQTGVVNSNGSIDQSPADYFASAAFFPLANEVVLFGGCSLACPTNATWTYSGGVWVNVTGILQDNYIPALYGTSMMWDPAYGSVLLVGGFNAAGAGTNSTWEFTGASWINITFLVGYADALFGYGTGDWGLGFASLAYDDALHEAVLVDGCIVANCSDVWNQYWVLNDLGWSDAGYPGDSGGAWTFNWGQQMAYDPTDGWLVLFGGNSYNGGMTNQTFVFNGSGWTNYTDYGLSGCFIFCFYPPAREYGVMTWDQQLGVIVMYGGIAANFSLLNDTWYFLGGYWSPANLFVGIGAAPAGYGFAMPTNSSQVTPFLQGGICLPYCFNSTWVFEIPPQAVIYHLAPNPADAGILVNFTAGFLNGTGSGPFIYWTAYDFAFDNYYTGSAYTGEFNASLVVERNLIFPAALTTDVEIYGRDFWGLYSYSFQGIVVNAALSTTPVVTPSPTEVGVAATFSSNLAGGTGPYNYTWDFGDGSGSYLAAPSHTYSTSGTFHGSLQVADGATATLYNAFTEVVHPALTVSAARSSAAVDTATSVSFTSTPLNGVGPYVTYAWSFGDHTTSSLANATHSYSTAGTYTVYLNVTDSLGVTAEATTTVTVHNLPDLSLSSSTLSPTTATTVSFTATPANGTAPFTYAWDFGDGTTGTGATPTHKYGSTGTYTVTATVTDASGKTKTKTLTETVSAAPAAGIIPGTTPTESYGIIGAILLVVVLGVLAAVMSRRRRKAAPASPPMPPAGSAPGTGSPPPAGSPPSAPPPGAT